MKLRIAAEAYLETRKKIEEAVNAQLAVANIGAGMSKWAFFAFGRKTQSAAFFEVSKLNKRRLG